MEYLFHKEIPFFKNEKGARSFMPQSALSPVAGKRL
jgi:hypothetical protein